MDRASSPDNQQSLSASYSSCIELYQRLLGHLATESCRIVHLKQVNAQQLLEEYGRLRIWDEQTRVALPELTRGSLDDTIRSDEKLRRTVNGILEHLGQLLSMAVPIAEKTFDDSAQDSESSMSTDSDMDSLNSDQEKGLADTPQRKRPKIAKISVLVKHIIEQIQTLYRFSALLRRPGLSGRYLRSSERREDSSKVSHFAEFDYRHIREKLYQWEGKSKIIASEEGQEETTTTIKDIEERDNELLDASNKRESLCRRLSKANTKRREQLEFWANHPDQPGLPQRKEARVTPEVEFALGKTIGKSKTVESKSAESLGLLRDQRSGTSSQAPQTITSKQSFSTVVASELFETQTKTRPRTIYAQSTVGTKPTNRVPDVPKMAQTSPTFECPYCHLILDSKLMIERLVWKRHVFRDLRPYVCTFLGCVNPDKQYLTRHNWIYHEQQMHYRQWVCGEHCQQKFPTKELILDHLLNNHSSSINSEQLSTIVTMSERPIDEGNILACPLCPDELSLVRLRSHVAEHLEAISLFVLPPVVDETQDTDSNDVALQGSNILPNESGSQPTLSSLDFSQSEETSQSKEEFSKLISMDEMKAQAKCESWQIPAEILRGGPITANVWTKDSVRKLASLPEIPNLTTVDAASALLDLNRPLPSCPRFEPSETFDDWYVLKDSINFDVCPSCFDGVFRHTPFETSFTQSRLGEEPENRGCNFSSVWERLAWLLTIKQQRKTLDLFYTLDAIDNAVAACPGNRKRIGSWWGFTDGESQIINPNFLVCICDLKKLSALFPSLRGYFFQLLSPELMPVSREALCALRVSSRRFPKYLDLLIEIDAEATLRSCPPDIQRLFKLADALASKGECEGDKAKFGELWYYIPSLPELTVCDECFDDVVVLAIVEASNLADIFNPTPQLVPAKDSTGTSCCLYSSRMRGVWREYLRSGNFDYLKETAIERKKVERRLVLQKADAQRKPQGSQWLTSKLDAAKIEEEWNRFK